METLPKLTSSTENNAKRFATLIQPCSITAIWSTATSTSTIGASRKLHRHLFCRWTDFEQFRCDYSQLLAFRGLRRRNRQCPSQRRYSHSRFGNADRLLRWLVAQTAHHGRLGWHRRQNHLFPCQPPLNPLQSDGQLPWHHAKRMGRSASFFIF